ncbi:MAG: hypothetical protein N2594_04325 [Clostridiales bacterium]|nr:hypothetical protein [Clostridiales bacterium]
MKNKAFTLIENIIMLFVISIITLAILELNIQNIKINKTNNDNYGMFLIAKSICEIYISQENTITDNSYLIYLNNVEDLKYTIEECTSSLTFDNSKRLNVYLSFETINSGLNKLTVKVKNLENNKEVILSCYK